jgi:type IV pilus assembly protein PilY1
MNSVRNGIGWAAVGAAWALMAGAPAIADDTEIFRYTPPPGTRANVLFVIDDSISMGNDILTPPKYDAGTTYQDPDLNMGCDPNKIYWKAGTGAPPKCNATSNWFNRTALKCDLAVQALFSSTGKYYDSKVAQYDPTGSTTGRWLELSSTYKDRVVECQDDSGTHGDGGTAKYAANGLSPAPWSAQSNQEITWGKTYKEATFYSANFINWYYGPGSWRTRLDVVTNVVDDLLETLQGVNVGLMDFNPPGGSGGSNGGSVSVAMAPIETNRAEMRKAVGDLTASSYTPLAETLFEARQYYAGKRVTFGTNSVDAAKSGNNYKSPINEACQENFVVYLTDGEPTYDNDANDLIKEMVDANGDKFETVIHDLGEPTPPAGICDVEAWAGIDFATPPGGLRSFCLDDVAEFLYEGDISDSLDDDQRVRTITVGFTVDLPVLKEAAERGNGRAPGDSEGVYFVANDAAQLSSVFSDIIGGIQDTTSSFAAPAVAVNAFNRTENLSDLFVSVFQPSLDYHWPGNLKKYRLAENGVIVDSQEPNGQPAVDPATGLFVGGTRSYWSTEIDGADVTKGGAANIIPANRRVFTNLVGSTALIPVTDAAVNAALLGTGATFPTRDDIVNFIRGINPTTGQPRHELGDPLHSQPVSFIYGPELRDGLVFLGTNDGYLHAFHANTGVEQWAFMPREFLSHQIDLLENDPYGAKHYGVDGPLKIHFIGDSDGVIETGEKVYLYVGMRRGGSSYYALDITNAFSAANPTAAAPTLLWRHDYNSLIGLGESWSPPVPTKVKIGTTVYDVVVIGGGYDTRHDLDTPSGGNDAGNSIYIVEATTGTVLWRGSKTAAASVTKTFSASGRPAMDYSFPGEIRVLDLNGDKLMDRMYAADMGGQIWRFDVTNGNSAANLIAGGVIAQLGAARPTGDPAPTAAENRRFYYAPDIARVNTGTQHYIHIGIGSGHREHPLGTVNSDRFYALRDTDVAPMNQAAFDGYSIIREANLPPVTTTNHTVQTGDRGWRIDLQAGEKVLAEARTISNSVFFTTFRPGVTPSSCQPQPGFNRLYRVNVNNGAPVLNLDGGLATEPLSMADMYVESTGSIPSTSQVVFVSRDTDGDGIPDDQDADDDDDGTLDVDDHDQDNDGIPDDEDPDDNNNGIPDDQEGLGDQGWVCTDRICVPLGSTNAPVRTYWRQTSVD